jgi:YebC/PmpR family DNA-binding regulatory protein
VSGHSKWSSIKHKKAAIDAKRGQLFTKVARDITMAVRQGGDDPEMNPGLRLAISKAKDANMPNANIDRAIQRGAGGGDADNLEEVTYEGYGPGGTAVLVDAVTDNRNRTVAEVRLVFSRGGGNLAENGAVAWQFEARGSVTVKTEGQDPDEIQLAAIEAGALDVEESSDGSTIEVITDPATTEDVRSALTAAGFEIESADLLKMPQNTVELDEQAGIATLKLLERLDDLDDVSKVHSNAVFPDSVLEAAAG